MNSQTLFMGIQINLVTVEIRIEIAQRNEIKIVLPYIAIPFLGIYLKTILYIHELAFFQQYYKAKLWTQVPFNTTIDKENVACILLYTDFYLVITKNEMVSFAGKFMKLKTVILNEISHTHKTKYYICIIQTYETVEPS